MDYQIFMYKYKFFEESITIIILIKILTSIDCSFTIQNTSLENRRKGSLQTLEHRGYEAV